jgi:hypothetical protein
VTKKTVDRLASRYSETAQAIATPSSLLVARPSSSSKIRECRDALVQMNAVSLISSMKVEMLCSWSSALPMRVQSRSKSGIEACSAGT